MKLVDAEAVRDILTENIDDNVSHYMSVHGFLI